MTSLSTQGPSCCPTRLSSGSEAYLKVGSVHPPEQGPLGPPLPQGSLRAGHSRHSPIVRRQGSRLPSPSRGLPCTTPILGFLPPHPHPPHHVPTMGANVYLSRWPGSLMRRAPGLGWVPSSDLSVSDHNHKLPAPTVPSAGDIDVPSSPCLSPAVFHTYPAVWGRYAVNCFRKGKLVMGAVSPGDRRSCPSSIT